jgi:hypothetical protein
MRFTAGEWTCPTCQWRWLRHSNTLGSMLAPMGSRSPPMCTFGPPHPRSFDTHTRILDDLVGNRHVLTLEEAIRNKMTSQPADRLGIADRGLLRKGMKAGVVVFNPAMVSDTSTYAKPGQCSKGVKWVFVNGTSVVADKNQPMRCLGALCGDRATGPDRHNGRLTQDSQILRKRREPAQSVWHYFARDA